ncbi:MAG: hypothetical protein JKY70_12160 [Mucilaginibacter sp.]|nr:hypothetical protein [Mucilaginibacter sp.]
MKGRAAVLEMAALFGLCLIFFNLILKNLTQIKMKKSRVTLLIVAVILVIAVLTNPNQLKHKESVKKELTEYLHKDARKHGGPGWAMVNTDLVSSDNYLFFSLTKGRWKGDSKIIGIGVFGKVFTFDNINESGSPDTD